MAGMCSRLHIRNGATPDSQVRVTADRVVLSDASGRLRAFSNVDATASTASTGANALDAGTVANSTWYAVWGIGNSSGTFAVLLSTSATSPTLPSGYTFRHRLGWVRTNGSALLLRTIQRGRRARYQVVTGSTTTTFPLFNSNSAVGNPSTPTWVSTDISAHVPSTAVAVTVLLRASTSGGSGYRAIIVAPSSAYGALGATNPPPASSAANDTGSLGIVGGYTSHDIQFETAQTLFVAANTTCYAAIYGWDDDF